MNTKEKKLFEALSQAYAAPDVKKDPTSLTMIETNAQMLGASDNPDIYLKVVTNLSNAISKYYLAHHSVPNELLTIFNQIKADVPESNVDSDFYRKKAQAAGLAAFPIIFH